MSRITNATLKPGESMDAAPLNQVFTDVTNATQVGGAGKLNADNVRNEGVDIGQVVGTSGTYDTIIKFVKRVTSGTPTAYAAGSIHTILTMAVGSEVFDTTDLFRAYWQIEVTDNNLTPSGTASIRDNDILGGLFWAVWLEWETAAGWGPVPGQDTYGTYSGHNGFRTVNCPALMPFPAVIRATFTDTGTGATVNHDVLIPDNSTSPTNPASFMGSYVRSPGGGGAANTYINLRLRLRGLFRGANDATPASYLNNADGDYSATNSITIRNINFGHILMKVI